MFVGIVFSLVLLKLLGLMVWLLFSVRVCCSRFLSLCILFGSLCDCSYCSVVVDNLGMGCLVLL